MKGANLISRVKHSQRTLAYLFLLPNLIGYITFILIPVVFAFIISFTNWDGFNEMEFVGLSNYTKMFQDKTFQISIKNNFVFTFVTVPASMILGFVVALIMNQKLKGVKLFRTIYFMPYVTAMVAVSVVWSAFYHPSMGPINLFLKSIGFDHPPKWLSSSDWAMTGIMIMSTWKNFGYNMIIFLAGLQGIPKGLYEAAEIDGATGIKKIIHITIPMLSPTIFLVSIMGIITSFKVFDQIYMMTAGGPGRATNVLVYYIYKEAFNNNRFGYASAVAYVLFAIILIVTIIQFRQQKKWVNY